MSEYNQLDSYLEKNIDESLAELSKLVAQPSVGAQNLGLKECAALVAEMLQARGFDVRIMDTKGAPVVFGERKGRSDKTLLIYNHYDVQPPEPLELWETPPFEPALRNGKLYGRGVSDDKDLLKADACMWEFGGVDHTDTPMQYLGLRGICYVELSVDLLSTDVHSGLGGSIFPNAAWRLVWALNSLKGQDERILIPGFYDNIQPPSTRDRELMSALPDPADQYKSRYGVPYFLKGLTGGVELKLEEVFSPTCTICGLTSGYQGPGSKTVLPAKASAKVDFRLVPDQDPADILIKLRAHLDAHGFTDVEITDLGGDAPARTDPDDPFIQLVTKTAEEVYEKPMMLVPLVGGSGPSHPFVHVLGLPVATAGLGFPDTKAHAPNENIRIDLYLKHARHMARLIKEFAG